MKNLIIVLLLGGCTIVVYGQDSTMTNYKSLIGGSFNIDFHEDEADIYGATGAQRVENRDTYSINPYYGKFIGGNTIIVGLEGHLGNQTNHYYSKADSIDYTEKRESKSYGATLFVKKLIPIKGNFGIFARLGLGYRYNDLTGVSTRQDFSSTGGTVKTRQEGVSNQYQFGLDCGIYYFISKRFSLETTIVNPNYVIEKEEDARFHSNGGWQIINKRSSDFRFYFVNRFTLTKLIVINYYF